MNETIYINKEKEEILKEVPGHNVSKKVAYLLELYKDQMGSE